MKRLVIHLIIIVAIAGVVLFTHLGTPRLWDRDEPRNAGCAVEMLERGNLVVPTFNDQLRHQKPVLLYWLIISAYQFFGVNEFAARFWSAVLAMGTVLATYAIGRRLLNPNSALFGAVALSTSAMFVVAGRAATPDSVLMFCSTVAIAFYVLGTYAPKQNPADAPRLRCQGCYFPRQWWAVVGMYALMGLGVLAKGPVAVVMPCAIIGMFMLIQRLPPVDDEIWNSRGWLTRLTTTIVRPFHPIHFATTVWKMRPITAAVIVALIATPWYIAVGIQTDGQWLAKFFLNEHLGRATVAQENHGGGLWYYPVAIMLGFFPWSVFMAPVLFETDRQLTRKHHWSPAYCLLLCWIGVQVGLFSFAQTKLPSYVTPCYPALALLTGAFLWRFSTQRKVAAGGLIRLALVVLGISGVAIVLAFAVIGQTFLKGNLVIAALGMIPIVGAALALWFWAKNQNRLVVFCCQAMSVLFAIGLFGFGAAAVDSQQTSNVILDQIASSPENVKVATYRCLESSWVFYGKRPISELLPESSSELTQHSVSRDPTTDSHFNADANPYGATSKPWPTPHQFATHHPDGLIITTSQFVDELQGQLPQPYHAVQRTRYFLRDKDLVLLAPASPTSVARQADTSNR